MKNVTRFRCVVCGKLTAGRFPANPSNHKERGDGTFRYPRKHNGQDGDVCPGCYEEADWVDTIDEVQQVTTRRPQRLDELTPAQLRWKIENREDWG